MQTDIIVQGNSIEKMRELPDNSVDLIFADPPYWMRVEGTLVRAEGTDFDGCDDEWDQFETLDDYNSFTRQWLTECYRVLKKDGSFWVIGSMQCIYSIGAIMQELGFWFINDVVWHKKTPHPTSWVPVSTTVMRRCYGLPSRRKASSVSTTRQQKSSTMIMLPTPNTRKVSTSRWVAYGASLYVKAPSALKTIAARSCIRRKNPKSLLYRVIAISSEEGDIVLDPFGGTFTTAAVAKKLGRHYISYDMDEKYCKYGKRRLANIKYEPDDISRAVFDIKPLKVSVEEMIHDGFLFEGEKFSMKGKAIDGITLKSTGKLDWNGEETDMHSCAAKVRQVKAARLNGFDFWCVERDGELKKISDIREEYRAWRATQTNEDKSCDK